MGTKTVPVRARLAAFAMCLSGRIAARSRDSRRAWTTPRSGAAVCLPAALASLLSGLVPAPGRAAARMDVHDQIQGAANTGRVSLTLMNGQTVSGVFHGFVGEWRDSASADARYLAWRGSAPEGVPQLDDSMLLVLASGDSLRGRFRGVGETFIALDTGNPAFVRPVEYSTIRATRGGSDDVVSEWTKLRTDLRDAPNLIGVLLQQNSQNMLVEREAISSVVVARSEPPASSNDSGNAALALVIGVILVGVFCAVQIHQQSNDFSNSLSTCGQSGSKLLGPDARYASSSVSGGLAPWKPGETRRP